MIAQTTLQTLIDLATEAVEKAAIVLGHTMRAGQEAEQRLEMLDQYRDDYLERFSQSKMKGLLAQDYLNYQRFLDKLDEALAAQKNLVRQAHERIEEARAAWQQCERKKKTYEILQSRAKNAQIRKENRREQRDVDEFNSAMARRTGSGSKTGSTK